MKSPKVVWVLVDSSGIPFNVFHKRDEAKDAAHEYTSDWQEKAFVVKYSRHVTTEVE